MATIKLGDLLIKANVLQESQLKLALAEQHKWGGRLGETLVRMELISEEVLVRALSKQLAIPAMNLDAVHEIPPHVKAKIPLELARDLEVVPLQLRDDGKTLVVAMTEPQNIEHIDLIRARSNCRVVTQVAGRSSVARALVRFYEGEVDLSDSEGSFRVMDAQGRTVMNRTKDAEQPARPAPKPQADLPVDLLRAVEDVQRKEVAAIRAMLELLIEKGVFSREEYLAKVKRQAP